MSKSLNFFKKGGKHPTLPDVGAARPLTTAAGNIRPSDFSKLTVKPGKDPIPPSIVDAAISVSTKVN